MAFTLVCMHLQVELGEEELTKIEKTDIHISAANHVNTPADVGSTLKREPFDNFLDEF